MFTRFAHFNLVLGLALAFSASVAMAKVGDPIPSIPVGLEGDPGSINVSTTTGADGTFHFDKLPAGNYKLTVGDLPSQPVKIGKAGTLDGTVMCCNDGGPVITVTPINDAPSARDPIGMDGASGMGEFSTRGPGMGGGGPVGP